MKLSIVVALLATSCVAARAEAKNLQPVEPVTPLVTEQPSAERILSNCAADKADTLPNPFTDLPSNHWAYKAVLSMYYCGAYRRAIPQDLVKPFLERQSQSTSWSLSRP